jgi:hypothetical protein
MNVCVKRVDVLLRWELRRFFEMGGLKEVASCFFGASPIGLCSALLGDSDLMLIVVVLAPAASSVTALQSFIKEREGGILPALLSSPVTAGELVLGKTMGYFILGTLLYWAAIFGTLIGLKVGLLALGEPIDGGPEIWPPLTLAIAMTSVVMVIVAATVSICWHAITLRSALFWSLAGAGLAACAGLPLLFLSYLLGAVGILLVGCAVAALTVGVALHHAGRLAPEPVLYRWVRRQSGRGQVRERGRPDHKARE